jgi:hypothetical protein
MNFDSLLDEVAFDEVVFFELPDEEEAERLWLRLQPARMAWIHLREDVWFVAAVLRADTSDLASLLRDVEDWLADRGLSQVRFELDGRTYSLRGRSAQVAGAASLGI